MLDLAETCQTDYHFWVGVILQVSILILVMIGVWIGSIAHKDKIRRQKKRR
jgi:hypothetical protein